MVGHCRRNNIAARGHHAIICDCCAGGQGGIRHGGQRTACIHLDRRYVLSALQKQNTPGLHVNRACRAKQTARGDAVAGRHSAFLDGDAR